MTSIFIARGSGTIGMWAWKDNPDGTFVNWKPPVASGDALPSRATRSSGLSSLNEVLDHRGQATGVRVTACRDHQGSRDFKTTDARAWHYIERGSGRPLILLHGLGMSHAAWNAVTPHVCTTRRVIAFDIAGFGRTPPLPPGVLPTVANLVDDLHRTIQDFGIQTPVDIAGNSLGGTMALEAARRGIARSVVAISPAGLWTAQPAPYVPYVFASLRLMATHVPGLMKAAMRPWPLRELALAVPMTVGIRRMPVNEAIRAVDDLAIATAFEETFENTRAPYSAIDIGGPVTVAFGARDLILPRSSRRRDRLPAHTRWIDKPGWGHVPMWVDPVGVAQVILEGTAWVGCSHASAEFRRAPQNRRCAGIGGLS